LGTNRAERKRAAMRAGLAADRPYVAVGAHDAMSAQLIEGYGFDAVWVSGFAVATMTHALPDLNLTTMTETLAASVRIDGATDLPVLADCDNGFGGLSNVVRTVIEFERAGIAGICVEDNLFPKRNSLYSGQSKRELVPVEEQARRIRAGKAAQDTDSFVLVARVEALIAGHGVAAACERADAYAEAGARALPIHSEDQTPPRSTAFMDTLPGPGGTPLVAAPTLFPDYTDTELHAKGFQMIILANHPMRAAVQAMEQTLETLRTERKAAAVDPHIAPVDHIFELVRTKEAIALEETGG